MKYLCIAALTVISVAEAQVEKFAPGVISNDRVFATTFTRDQKTVYFVNSRGGRDTLTISSAVLKNGIWSTPETVSFSTQPGVWKDIDPFITPDGKTLIFNSNRPTADQPDKKDFDVWAVKLKKDGWGTPYNLGKEINSEASDFFATATKRGDLYFSSTRSGNPDLYRAVWKNGVYEKVEPLADLNTSGDESNPYISPDEDFMIFLSQRQDGFGDSDLYISFHENGKWTTPLNLGKGINTQHAEFAPYFHTKTNTLYFSRIIRGKPLVENIFFTKLRLKELRSTAIK